jgi:hypothetical protein
LAVSCALDITSPSRGKGKNHSNLMFYRSKKQSNAVIEQLMQDDGMVSQSTATINTQSKREGAVLNINLPAG